MSFTPRITSSLSNQNTGNSDIFPNRTSTVIVHSQIASPPHDFYFVERKNHRENIAKAFYDGHKIVVLTPASGIRCKIGKTEIAKDYVFTYGTKFTNVIWININSRENIQVDAEIANWLKVNNQWLLVLDGLNNQRELNQIPFYQNGHILITTRDTNWENLKEATTLPIGPFSQEEGISYLQGQSKEISDDSAREICLAVGLLPTSLRRAADQISEWGIKPQYYLHHRMLHLEARSAYLKKRSNLPPRNKAFVGREGDLLALKEAMEQGKPLVIAAEVGLGGIGKTQIALQYAYRAALKYEFIWWINSENITTLTTSYEALAKHLGISLSQGAKSAKNALIDKVNFHLQQHPSWLLIFDDVEGEEAIREYLPKSGGHVLITSRSTKWGGLAQVFKVGVFNPGESVDLLIRITRCFGQEQDAAKLAEILHHLPLAVAQAACYIVATEISISKYIEKFNSIRPVLWEFERSPEELYKYTVNITWRLSMDKIVEEENTFRAKWGFRTGIALPLMQACSLLGPRDIPRALVLKNWIKSSKTMHFLQLNQALETLRRFSMIDLTDQSVNIHGLVQMVVRDAMLPSELTKAVSEMVHLFHDYRPEGGQHPIFSYWEPVPEVITRLYDLLPHALSLATFAESLQLKGSAMQLMMTMGTFSYHQGNYQFAETILSRCLAIEKSDGVYLNLGNVYVGLGKIKEAEKCYEKCNNRDGLIDIAIAENRLDDAERLIQQQMERFLKIKSDSGVVGDTKIEYFMGFNLKKLGIVHIKKNQPKQAIDALQKSKTMFDEAYKDKPDKTFSANIDCIIAEIYAHLQKPDHQEAHLLSALSVYEKILNKNKAETIHSHLISILKTLGILAKNRGDLFLAAKKLGLAAELSQIKLGIGNQTTLSILEQLANIYYDLEELDLAISTYESINKEKNDLQGIYHNLGCLYHLKGKTELAKISFEKAIALGGHSGTFVEYANFLLLNKHHKEAIPHLLQVISLPDDGRMLSYGKIEVPSLPEELQNEARFWGNIVISARYLAYFLLIQAHLESDQKPEAEKLCLQFETELASKAGTLSYSMLGYLWKKMSNNEKAMSAFREALKFNEENETAQTNLALLMSLEPSTMNPCNIKE